MKLGIFGLGYVGTVSLACFSSLGHKVIGTDIKSGKVTRIRNGESPVREPGLEKLIRSGLSSGRIEVTRDPSVVVSKSDISFICVGTPDNGAGGLELAQVERVCRDIAANLRSGPRYPVVALRSTVLPGVTEDHMTPLLERTAGLRAGKDFGVCFNPEFLREGSAVQDFLAPPFSVIGRCDERTARVVARLYSKLDRPVRILPARSAEMLKYACNAFHALKIAFANEIGVLCGSEGIEGQKLMELFCEDPQLNISDKYLAPGFAFGGSCLPRDLRVLLRHAGEKSLELPVLESILPSNERLLDRCLNKIRAVGSHRIGILGLSFKAGTDDLRESPGVELAGRLIEQGYEVRVFDPNIDPGALEGQGLAFVKRRIPEFATRVWTSLDALMAKSELIVITTQEETFSHALPRLSREQVLIDLTSSP